MSVSVVEATERDLAAIRRADPSLADSGLAALALALAARVDDPGNSATSVSMCGKTLADVLATLRGLVPEEVGVDGVDDLAARRDRRLGRRATA